MLVKGAPSWCERPTRHEICRMQDCGGEVVKGTVLSPLKALGQPDQRISPYAVRARIIPDNRASITASDVLAPYDARSSLAMLLTLEDE